MNVQKTVLYKIPSRYLKNKSNLEKLEIIRVWVLHMQRRSSNKLLLSGLGETILHSPGFLNLLETPLHYNLKYSWIDQEYELSVWDVTCAKQRKAQIFV